MEESCDVVVMGAGGAGMTAALAAANHGLDTVLIEKSAYFGASLSNWSQSPPLPISSKRAAGADCERDPRRSGSRAGRRS